MRVGVVDKRIKCLVIGAYVVLPAMGYIVMGLLLSILGLFIANTIDRIMPKWGYDLSWKDIEIGITNLYKYGLDGSLFCVKKDKKKIFIYRDEKGDPVRMGFMIPVACWKGIIDKSDFESLAIRFESYYHFIVKDHKEQFAFFPYDHSPENCLRILKFILENYSNGLNHNVLARVDGAKEDIWKGVKTESA